MSVDWRGIHWSLRLAFCVVIIRCKETFWSPCIIEIIGYEKRIGGVTLVFPLVARELFTIICELPDKERACWVAEVVSGGFAERLRQILSASKPGSTRCGESASVIYIIITIRIKGWAIWPAPSPQLQLLSPTFLCSPNCCLSLWTVAVWF
jgi:hypothetical protein